ncbi:MAG TPA: phage tail sheath C-terminal domain-containing protein [Dongiaceae bacterium]|nr:phage tail sheath C-terminal domain-containing protein [Dongiaceae bacterium]
MKAPYPGVYVEEITGGTRAIEGVPTSVAAFIGRATQGPRDLDKKASPTSIASWAEYERVFGGLDGHATMGHAVRLFFANGGKRALIVRVGKKNGAPITDADISSPKLAARKRGLWALERAQDVNLLCIPPLSQGADGDIGAVTRQAAIAYCRRRRAMFIVDPLSRWQSVADVLGPDGIDSASFGLPRDANAALYFPFLRILQDGTATDVPPSGAVAGLVARTDETRGVWKAPAGLDADLRDVAGPAIKITDEENGELNPRAVNCLRQFPGKGMVVWGGRTWLGDISSEWKYVNVRRLALFIEESVERGTQWAALEPNNETLWTAIRRDVGDFLHGLFRNGAFAGSRPQDAYFVKCDRSTMTQADIDQGRLIALIGIAPVKPAEFVILRISHKTASEDDEP